MSIETVTLSTIDGVNIEGDVATAAVDRPIRGGVVLAHPHPLHGGDRFNPVVDTLFRVLPAHGFHAVRFDFRGAGGSFGEHDGGDSERLDVAAAIDFLAPFNDDIWAIGYSFGSVVALNVVEPRVSGWIAIAPPLLDESAVLAGRDPRPKLLLVPEHDQFCPAPQARERSARWFSTTIVDVPGTDHFLHGRVSTVAERVVAFLDDLSSSEPT
ncbi:MAG: alpha/beta hydrolase [Acidimicrobiia bacterium]